MKLMLWKCWIELLKISQIWCWSRLLGEVWSWWVWFLFSVEFPVSLTSWIYRRKWWSLQFSRLFWWSEESVHQLRDKLEDFCKEELKKISDRVKSWDSSALRNQSIIISYHGEHHIRNVLGMDAGSWESHCSCLLISTVTFTNIVPRTRNGFLQCKSVRKQAEKLTECVHVLL